MTTPSQFVKNQNRSFFNIHTPIPLSYDDQYVSYNKRGPLQQQSEIDAQTGSGRAIVIHRRFQGRSEGITRMIHRPLRQCQFGERCRDQDQ